MGKTQRYRLRKDDSGHDYVVPIELEDEFDKLVEDEYGWEKEGWQKFEDMRIENFTFTDPKPDN